jgi:hypothetical protein
MAKYTGWGTGKTLSTIVHPNTDLQAKASGGAGSASGQDKWSQATSFRRRFGPISLERVNMKMSHEIETAEAIVGVEENTSLLRCLRCNETWCEHVASVVTDAEDAVTLWEDLEKDDGDADLLIPLYPSGGIWVLTALRAVPDFASARMILLHNEQESSTYELGFLSRGDGRGVVRSILIDWFSGMYGEEKRRCPLTSHGYREEMAYAENMKSIPFYENWSIWHDGKCLSCARGVDTQDFSDLIPQIDDNKIRF